MCVNSLVCIVGGSAVLCCGCVLPCIPLSTHTLGYSTRHIPQYVLRNRERSPCCLCICPSMCVRTEDVTYSAYVCAICANYLMYDMHVHLSVLCQSSVSHLSVICHAVICQSSVSPLSVLCQSSVSPLSVLCQSSVSPLLVICQPSVSPLSVLCQSSLRCECAVHLMCIEGTRCLLGVQRVC